MFLKKLLATIASIALTGGALLGVSAPAFAEDVVVPASSPDVAISVGDTGVPGAKPSPVPMISSVVSEDPAPIVRKSDPVVDVPKPLAEEKTPGAAVPGPTELSAPATQSQGNNGAGKGDHDKKVWVCKFVSSANSPTGYRLKDGKQPIEVSVNSVGGDVSLTGDFAEARTFNDAQPSFVVAEDDVNLCSRSEVTVDEEVVCPAHERDGVVNVTTTTTTYYGVAQAGITITHSTRELTVQERVACDPPEEVLVCQFEASTTHPSGWVLAGGDQPVSTLLSDLSADVRNSFDYSVNQPSFIVANNDSALCSSKKVERSKQVTCSSADADGYATITTVRSYFYGSVLVKERTTAKVRVLTEREIRDCPPVEPVRATAEVSLTTAGCNAPQQLILGPIANATWGEVTDPEGPLGYSVTATANAGAEFVSGGPAVRAEGSSPTLTFAGTLDPQLDPFDPECDLVTLGLVMPAVSFSQTSCTAAGSYRLGVAAGYDPALVTFTVNGVAGIVAGTYQAASPGPVVVTAQVVAPNGLEFGWVDPPAFVFVASSDAGCDSALPTLAFGLPTLAFTGGGGVGPFWWLIPASMILLGAAAIYVRRRMDVMS
ncbi:MAG: hypothetical protein ACOH1M_01575 [Rhodoglobus sp.]